MKKSIVTFLMILLSHFFVASVKAEGYDIAFYWVDLLFENERNPWTMQNKDLTFLDNTIKNFNCKNQEADDGSWRSVCVSKKGEFQGSYMMTFSFNREKKLNAVEIIVFHPYLKKIYELNGSIESKLSKTRQTFRYKPYFSENKTVMVYEDNVHTWLNDNVDLFDTFKNNENALTLGSINDKIVINISSVKYYNEHYYHEYVDETTGQTHKLTISNMGF